MIPGCTQFPHLFLTSPRPSPLFTILASIIARSFIYIVYNAQVMMDPTIYATYLLYCY